MAEKATQDQQEAAPVETSRKYVVFETIAADGTLKQLGVVTAKTSKEARRSIAQAQLPQERLEKGVSLVAVTENAILSGSGVAKVKVEQRWDD